MSQDAGILVVIGPITLEENLIDFLLERDHPTGFCSQRISGHSSRHEGLSLREQVSGREQRVRFEVLTTRPDAEQIVDELGTAFGNISLHYWFVPAAFSGRLA